MIPAFREKLIILLNVEPVVKCYGAVLVILLMLPQGIEKCYTEIHVLSEIVEHYHEGGSANFSKCLCISRDIAFTCQMKSSSNERKP